MPLPTNPKFVTNGKWNPLYKAWVHLRQRCRNQSDKDYARWGGRGITICERWSKYTNFAEDMGPHPGKGWTLDRKDNEGDYEKNNCRWATRLTQGRNSRQTKLTFELAEQLRADSKAGMQQRALAAKYGVSKGTVHYVLKQQTWRP